MSVATVDPMGTPWTVVAPPATPGTVTIELIDSGRSKSPTVDPAMRITVPQAADGHRVRRVLPAPVDIRAFDDLLLWVRPSTAADGSAASPFLAELRVGSVASPINAASNTWHRFLPFAAARRWTPVLIGLHDLPDLVRSAVTEIQLRVEAGPWTMDLGPIRAIRSEIVTDVEAALVARWTNRLTLSGAPVPVVLLPTTTPLPATRFEIVNTAIGPAPSRAREGLLSTDFTAVGHLTRAVAQPIDLDYRVTAVAPVRAEQSRMVQVLLDDLASRPTLLAAGMPWPLRLVESGARDETAPTGTAMFIRVEGLLRSDRGLRAVPPFRSVSVEVEHRGAN